MIKQSKKGFTLVELVIVIAVIAILAGVLIGTFASVINRANDSANIQKTKSDEIAQKAEDIIKKIEDSGWVSWEDYEADIVKRIVEEVKGLPANSAWTSEQITPILEKVVNDAVTTYKATEYNAQSSGVTEAQVKAIVENAIGTLQYEGPTEAQVRAAVVAKFGEDVDQNLSTADIKSIIDKANGLKYTAADLARSIAIIVVDDNQDVGVNTILDSIKDSTRFLGDQITELKDTIKSTIDEAISNQELDDVVMAKALNIKIKRVGLTSANTPYEVLKEIQELGSTATFKSTVLLSLGEQFGFFVVNESGKVVNPCGLTLTVDENGVLTDAYKYWTFTADVSAVYSTYLTGTSYVTVSATGVGVDVGEATVSAINYGGDEESHEVVIRTNSFDTTLTIDAASDTVKHYGEVGSLNVKAVANASYHENGTAKFIEISKGRIALEAGAEVTHIHINAKLDNNNEKTDEFDKVIISYDSSVDLTEVGFSRDDVEIAAQGTLVVALQAGTETPTQSTEMDYVWLTKQGIYEQIKVSNTDQSAGNVWADDSSNSTQTQDAAQKIANNYVSETVRPTWESTNTTRDLTEITNATEVATAVAQEEAGEEWESMTEEQQAEAVAAKEAVVVDATQAIEAQPDKTDVETGATLFAGGTGTKNDPFLIVDYDTFQHVSDLFAEGYYYFKVKDGIETIDCKNWVPVYLNGSFDGNDVKLANVDQTLFMMIGMEGNNSELSSWTTTPVLLSDFTVELKCEGSIDTAQGLARNIYAEKVTYKNVKTTGTLISGSNGAIFFCYTAGNDCGYNTEHTWATVPSDFMQEIYVTDCSVETTIYAPSGSVGIIGGHYCAIGEHLKVVVNNVDSIFAGNYYNTSGKYNVMYGCAFAVTSDSTADPGQKTCSKISAATVTKGANSYTTTAVTNASYIKVYISAQLSETGTPLQGITMTLSELSTIENVISGSSYEVLSTFNSVNYSVKQNNFDAYVSNSTLYAKVGGNTNFDNGSIKLVVLQYSSTGELLASKITEIANKANISSNWTIN